MALRHGCQHGVGELGGSGRAAYVAGAGLALGIKRFEGLLHPVGRGLFVEVAQHEDGGLQEDRGVGHMLAGNVGGGALEDGALEAEVGAGGLVLFGLRAAPAIVVLTALALALSLALARGRLQEQSCRPTQTERLKLVHSSCATAKPGAQDEGVRLNRCSIPDRNGWADDDP